MTTLFLCAAGNPEGVRLALEVNDALQRWDRIVLLDDDAEKQGREIMGVRIVGSFRALADHQPGDEAVNLVARSTSGRDSARAKIESFGLPLTSLVHPSVNLRGASVGRAVTLYAGCTISALSSVGDHAVVFTQAVLGHGASLGAGAVLAPGAVVNARVQVGNRAYIGSNASVLPDLTIGEEATVSACSAAVGNVPAGCTALGVPAEIIGAPPPAAAKAEPRECGQNTDAYASLTQVQAVFAKILGAPSLGADVNFFDAGGNSKQALQLQIALRDTLGVAVTIVDIFRYPNPRQLTSHLFGSGPATPRPSRAAMRRQRHTARP